MLHCCSEHGLAQYQSIGSILLGWAFAHLADTREGLSDLRRTAISYPGTQRAYFATIEAETELRTCHYERAMARLNDAQAISEKLDETFWLAGALCVEGDVLRARCADDWRAAEECYRRAVVIAREQQAKSLELRAATRLAWLWHGKGRDAESRDLLAPVYGWFTEGFDTPDLKEAKALLTALDA